MPIWCDRAPPSSHRAILGDATKRTTIGKAADVAGEPPLASSSFYYYVMMRLVVPTQVALPPAATTPAPLLPVLILSPRPRRTRGPPDVDLSSSPPCTITTATTLYKFISSTCWVRARAEKMQWCSVTE